MISVVSKCSGQSIINPSETFLPASINLRSAMVLAAGLTLVATEASSAQSGRYRMHASGEIASVLILNAGRSFSWSLTDARTDERAQGRWRRSGGAVLLTTEPAAGSLELVRESAWLSGEWSLQVEVENEGVPIPGARLKVGFANGAPRHGITGAHGWRLSRHERRRPTWLRVELPTYGIRTMREPLFTREANSLRFQLQPVADGTVSFRDEPVVQRGKDLVLRCRGTDLVYERDPGKEPSSRP